MRYVSLMAMVVAISGMAIAEKQIGPVSSEDQYLVLTASAVVDRESVNKALGYDPEMDLALVEVNLAPRGDHKIKVSFDDFTLISRKDGQRSQPFAPSQIAGKGALVVKQDGYGGSSGIMNGGRRGPIWGGMPGTGTRPTRIGGDDGGAITAGTPGETKSTVNEGGKEPDNPLLVVLKERALPQDETNEPVSGLLYFLLEGKHKLKDLELMYESPGGRMILDFQK
jgi:hypothetical protein